MLIVNEAIRHLGLAAVYWNKGYTVEEVKEHFGKDVSKEFEFLQGKYGCACIPVKDFWRERCFEGFNK